MVQEELRQERAIKDDYIATQKKFEEFKFLNFSTEWRRLKMWLISKNQRRDPIKIFLVYSIFRNIFFIICRIVVLIFFISYSIFNIFRTY